MTKKKCAFLFFQLLFISMYSQVVEPGKTADFSAPEDLEIGGVKVTGAAYTDEAIVRSFSGLQVGDRVRMPGPVISNAVKNLLRQGLFSDVQILQTRRLDDLVFLEIKVLERPRLSGHTFTGVKKSKHDELNQIVNKFLRKGTIVNDDAKSNSSRAIRQIFIEKGYADVKVMVHEMPDSGMENAIRLVFEISKGKKIKVEEIRFIGNENRSSRKLQKLLDTKPRRKLLRSSKFVEAEWEQGKEAIVASYHSLGYLDASIVSDSIWRSQNEEGKPGFWQLEMQIEEGQRYYFGSIKWEGNSKYSDEQLTDLLGIGPGEVFDPLRLDERLQFSQHADDLTSLYMDDGHLFFNLEQEMSAIRGDTVDLKIRIFEGPQATVDKVVIRGNERTKDHVIRRELRTKPGKKFSRADIIRSQRAIANLGYFNPESIQINTPVNAERGTVDLEYIVEEKDNSQLELAAGWNGPDVGITGTLGITLNNFSLKNLLDRRTWAPFPMGDGQTVSLRVQSSGKSYQSYNFSFTEPWLGGKKPNSLTFGTYYTRYTNGAASDSESLQEFVTLGGTVGLGTRLSWPDDNFTSTTSLNFRQYRLNNWESGLFKTDEGQLVSEGNFNDLNIKQTITRSTINQPIFPRSGSNISLSVAITPPWSLFGKNESDGSPSEQFRLLEYQKWKFNAEHFTSLSDRLVLRTSAKFGFLGSFGTNTGTPPFGRYQLGGDPLTNGGNTFTGTDIITLRGYEVEDLENNLLNGEKVATPIYNKFTAELRYLISPNPSATIYALAFLEAGNSYRDFKSYNPFDLKRSAGLGLRVHLPMFGTMGFDYGLGFDKSGAKDWKGMGKFSIIIGFEPE